LTLTLSALLLLAAAQPLAAKKSMRTPKSGAARRYPSATPKARKARPAKNMNAAKPRKAPKQAGATPKAKQQKPPRRARAV
jgi:hypothetical protein